MPPSVDNESTAHAKVALFRSLFRGRDDVYARRFESRKTGKAGYAPACEHAAIERSRSGQGGHVWLFFEEAIPAAVARKLGAHILTETMERRPEAGLDSYDRFFPNQDTLPSGGFGNLIALPLQKQARAAGNAVFLDDEMVPHPDQWAFLSTVRRISRSCIEEIVQGAERKGRVVGVRLPPGDEGDDEPWTAPAKRQGRQRPAAPVRCGRLSPRPAQRPLAAGERLSDLALLAEDVAKDLDAVLDAIVHSVVAGRRDR